MIFFLLINFNESCFNYFPNRYKINFWKIRKNFFVADLTTILLSGLTKSRKSCRLKRSLMDQSWRCCFLIIMRRVLTTKGETKKEEGEEEHESSSLSIQKQQILNIAKQLWNSASREQCCRFSPAVNI